MNYFIDVKWKRNISQLLIIVFLVTLLVPTLPLIYGIGEYESVAQEVYEADDLAEKAIGNNRQLYEEGIPLESEYGNFSGYDVYMLTQANVNVSSWVYDGDTLEEEMLDLGESINIDDNPKKIAYTYLGLKGIKEDHLAQNLLDFLIQKQESSEMGGFIDGKYSEYSNMPVFEALGRIGVIHEINTDKAISYIIGTQDPSGGWPKENSDFLTTTQGIRSLIYLKDYAKDEKAVEDAIQKGMNWIQSKQQEDGSFNNGDWDDPVVDTVEVMSTLKVLEQDINGVKHKESGKGPVDYLMKDALNEDGTFGTNKNIVDNTAVLEACIMLENDEDFGEQDILNSLASKAAVNNLKIYETTGNLGVYDLYMLQKAKVDTTKWNFQGKNLNTHIITLAQEVIQNPNKKTTDWNGNEVNAYSSKLIAQCHLAMQTLGEEKKAQALLNILKEREVEGSFDQNPFSDLAAFEALGRADSIDQINTEKAILYILSSQDATGAWTNTWNDFQATAQGIRSLIYLKDYAKDKQEVEDAIQKGMNWIKEKQLEDGSFQNEQYDDPVIDTSEVIYILDLLKEDLNQLKHTETNLGPVDYMKQEALNEDGTFGTGKNNTDNTYALEAYVLLGANVSIKTDGDGGGNNNVEGEKVNISIKGYEKMILSPRDVELKNNDTVFTLTTRILDQKGIFYDVNGVDYFTNIGGDAEKEHGVKSGWMFNVDGQTMGSGSNSIALYGGEKIEWFYTLDYTTDSRNTNSTTNQEQSQLDGKINDIKKMLNNPNISEGEMIKGIQDITSELEKQAEKISTTKDADLLIEDIQKIYNIMNELVDRIKEEESMVDFTNESMKIMKVFIKACEVLKETDDEKITDTIKDYTKIMIQAMDKIKDQNQIKTITTNTIETCGKIIKLVEKKYQQEIEEKAIEIGQKFILLRSKQEIENKELNIEKKKVVATISSYEMKKNLKNLHKGVEDVENILNKNNIKSNNQLKNIFIIDIKTEDQKEVQVKLPFDMMELLKQNQIDKIWIQTGVASIGMNQNTFENEIINEEIILYGNKIERDDLSKGQKKHIPKNSSIVDLNVEVGEEKIHTFKKSIEVRIPYQEKLEDKETVEVFYLKDNGTIENMGGVYDPTTKLITFETSHFSKYFAKKVEKEDEKVIFNDLNDYEWAKEAIEEMENQDVIKGRSEGLFDPSAAITRAEFATLITKMLELKIEDINISFTDVEDSDWYTPYIKTAYKNGLISGKSDMLFDPNGNITREEMATIIGKVLTQNGKEKVNINELDRFSDKTNIAFWANENVGLCVKEGIISGMPDGTFMPKENANRAQAAVMLYKLYKSIK